jgi:hypothetical protein
MAIANPWNKHKITSWNEIVEKKKSRDTTPLINIEKANIIFLSSLSEMYPDMNVKRPYAMPLAVAKRPISNGEAESDNANIGSVIARMSIVNSQEKVMSKSDRLFDLVPADCISIDSSIQLKEQEIVH